MRAKYLFFILVISLLMVGACKQETVKPTTTPSTNNQRVVMPIDQETISTQKQVETPETNQEIMQKPPTSAKQEITSYTVKADDYMLDPKVITVKKGDILKITFQVSKDNVYYGGLDFRSKYFNTGKVLPGQVKEITLVPDQSFSYTSYWPSSGVEKATGQINVI